MSSNLIASKNLQNRQLQKKSKEIVKADPPALMIRQEIFETATVDNQSLDYQELQSPQLSSKKKIDKSVLLRSIENIMQYFDKEVNISEASGKSTPDICTKKGRVATAVANWSTSISNKQTSPSYIPSNTSMNPNCKLSSNKVGQLTKMFNSKISQLVQKNTVKQSQNIKSATPRLRRKPATYLTAFASPKASPKLRRRKLQKNTGFNTISTTKQIISEHVFQQLSVKDRVLLYEKFMDDLPNHYSKLRKISTIIKDGYVKKLRTEMETRLNETLPSLVRTKSKQMICTGEDTDSYTSNESTTITSSSISHGSLDDISPDTEDCLHVSRLAVVLKSSTKSSKSTVHSKSKKQYKQSPLPSAKRNHSIPSVEKPNEVYKSTKKNRRAYCNRLLAKIMPQQQQKQPERELIHGQQQIKQLFQKWLQEKHGVVFDIVPVTERIPKTQAEELSSDNRSDTNEVLSLIKQTIDRNANDNSIVELELPIEGEQLKKIPSENSLANPKPIDNSCNLSPNSKSTQSDNVMLNTYESKGKLPRLLSTKLEDSAIECQNQLSEDSDFDINRKTPSKHLIASTPKGKIPQKNSSPIKQLIFHPDNNTTKAEANEIFINKINKSSPMSTALSHTEYTISDNEITKNPPNSPNSTLNATHSNSYPTSTHPNTGVINSDRTQSVLRKFAEADSEVQNNLIDSFIDQGFETGSNATCSPTRSHQINVLLSKDKSICFTPNIIRNLEKMDEIHTDISSINDPCDNYSTLTFEQETPASLHIATKVCNGTLLKNGQLMGNTSTEDSDSEAKIKPFKQFAVLNNENTDLRAGNRKCSQFWISTGPHSISASIEFYEPSHLAILSRIFSKTSIKFGEMNFGIDDQKFSFGNRTSPDELIKRIPNIPNCSHYWFSTGNILIHFRGNLMNKNKIRKFFEYIQEFLDESGTLRFGIDSYDFSNTTSTKPQQSQQDPERIRAKKVLYNESTYSTDSLSSEPSIDFSYSQLSSEIISNSSGSSRSNHLPQDRTDIDAKMKIIERLQNKCQLIENSMENNINPSNFPATRVYWSNMQKMVANIYDISRSTGFKGCNTDQLATFMNILSSYADFSLSTCSQQTEQILNTISTQVQTTEL